MGSFTGTPRGLGADVLERVSVNTAHRGGSVAPSGDYRCRNRQDPFSSFHVSVLGIVVLVDDDAGGEHGSIVGHVGEAGDRTRRGAQARGGTVLSGVPTRRSATPLVAEAGGSRRVTRATTRLPPFTDVVEEHRAMVYRFLRVAVGAHDADDCFQETFLAALRAYPTLAHADALDRWLLRIASRKAIDHHRGAARAAIPVAELPDRAARSEPDEPVDAAVAGAVQALPPRQRVAVVHRLVFDRSYAEVATLMGSTEETARANVSQGVRRLRELMA
jgi:RNA polymerase sigma factor (sigma-70 family)